MNQIKYALLVDSIPKKDLSNTVTSFYNNHEKSFLIYNDQNLIKQLKKLDDTKIYAIVPDVTKYVREMTKYGLVGMGLRKLQSLGPINILKLALHAIKKPMAILKKNFRVLLPILVKADYLELKKLKPNYLFLHYQITDMALANDNKALVKSFLALSKKNYPRLGLMTKNLSFLDKKLKQWGLKVNYILAPFNYKGFSMRDSKNDCEALLSNKEKAYFSFGSFHKKDLEKELKYLQKLNVKKSFLSLTLEELDFIKKL